MDDNKDQSPDRATIALSIVAIAGFVAMLVYGANVGISARIVQLPNVVRISTAWNARSWQGQAGARGGSTVTKTVRERIARRQGKPSA
jgi:hypothetical protein